MKVASQTFSPSFFTSVPSYHPEFPNLVVIKGLGENVWMPSQPPRRTAASLNALVCCQPSTAVLS